MNSQLQLDASTAPNLADVTALQSFMTGAGAPAAPFQEWLRTMCSQLETQNSSEWSELHLVWELINHFINGDQILRKGHRFGGWVKVPMPDSTMSPVRQQNKLGFYSRTLMSKWVASRTKIQAVPGDDSEETEGACRAAQIFIEAIQPMLYSEQFRQQEGLAGQAHGTYARYFYFDPEDEAGGYADRPVTEQREMSAGEDMAACLECEHVGPLAEFQGMPAPEMGAEVAPEMAMEAPAPEMAQPVAPEMAESAVTGQESPGMAPVLACPMCGSPEVEVMPAEKAQVEVVTGTERHKLGAMKALSVPYTELRHEIASSAEKSPWLRWRRRVRLEELRQKFPGMRIPSASTVSKDTGLEMEDAMRRSVAQQGRGLGRGEQSDKQFYGDFTQWWFAPCMYTEYVFPTEIQTAAGETIPAGTKAADLFPDGMYVAIVEGIDAPLQVRNECHAKHWVTAPFHLRLFTGLGLGINDAVEMQKQWNTNLSLVFEQIRTAALPGMLYDKDAIEPDDVRLLGQPQNNVPVSLRNRPEGTRIEQLVHQLPPGQIPSHIPWYIGQLDANMQTSMGALINEGVPGMDSATATGAQIMASASAQHNAPEFALKGDADVRSMYLVFDLAKVHFVEPRYLPLSGKRGKQDGVWLSAADFQNGQIRFEAVKDSWMPSTKLEKQEAIQKLLLAFGGMEGLMMALGAMPDFVDEMADACGVDIAGDLFEPTTLLARQRIDQIKELGAQYAPIAQQVMEMNAMQPMAEMDPMTGMMMPVDPMVMIGDEIAGMVKPPVIPEEPAHEIAVRCLREWFLEDDGKEADDVTRAGVQALIRKHIEAKMLEQQIVAQIQAMGAPPVPPGEEEGGKPGQPEKTPADKRKDQAKSQLGGPPANPGSRPSPRPAKAAA